MEVRFSGAQGLGAVLTRPLRSAEPKTMLPRFETVGTDSFARVPRTITAQKLAEQAMQAKPAMFEYRGLNAAFAKAFMITRLL